MHPSATRRTRTFILRVWCEYLDETPPSWRGEIEDTRTQDTTRFSSLEQMSAIVHTLCIADPTAPCPPAWPTAPSADAGESSR